MRSEEAQFTGNDVWLLVLVVIAAGLFLMQLASF
jgi:hypothetical protein